MTAGSKYAPPLSRREFFQAMRSLLNIFERTATKDNAAVIARMQAELRYGADAVFDHLFERYRRLRAVHELNNAAVRLAEGEFYNDVDEALERRVPVATVIAERHGAGE